MRVVDLDEASEYRLDIRQPETKLTDKKGTNLKAFRLAIRKRSGGISLPDLLSAGPLPLSEGSIADFRDVHDRGLAEVATFLSNAE